MYILDVAVRTNQSTTEEMPIQQHHNKTERKKRR